ncbi:hypothetical protein Tco_0634593 [Tanacetum coccineum]
MYEKLKRSDENLIAIGSVEDERLIKDLNKKVASIKKADSIEKESKEEEGTKKRKLGTRKKIKSRKRRFRKDIYEDENDELRLCLTIALDEDKEVNYEILDKKYPIIECKSEHLGIKSCVLSIFDRDDLFVVYQLVMDKYQDEIPEDFDKVLWGDLMIMFNPSDEDEFWNSQQDWNVTLGGGTASIGGGVTPPEDLNVKFLRSLPSEWDTHVKVKKSVGINNDDKNLAFLTTSGASSTNIINTVNPEVSTGNTGQESSFQRTGQRRSSFDGSNTVDMINTKMVLDLIGVTWQREGKLQANMALMAFSDSESNSQLNEIGFVDSGCSRNMTGNIAHLSDFKDFDGGYVSFGGGAYGGRNY